MRTFISVTLMTALTIAAQAGTSHGGGGDLVYQDGAPIMRDFVATVSPELIPRSKQVSFLKENSDLESIINELARVHPEFALKVIRQLVDVIRIRTTEAPLPLLPANETALVGPLADIQAAIRIDDDVIISLPAFRKTPTKGYLLLHEAMHGLVGGHGAIHHMYVRSIIKSIKDGFGKMTTDEFISMAQDNGVEIYSIKDQPKARLQQLLLGSVTNDPLTCVFYSHIKDGHMSYWDTDFYGSSRLDLAPNLSALAKWKDLSSCKTNSDFNFIASKWPTLARFMQRDPEFDINKSILTIVPTDKPTRLFPGKWSVQLHQDYCRLYAKPEQKTQIEEEGTRVKKAIEIARQANSELQEMKSSTVSPLESSFYEMILKGDLYSSYRNPSEVTPELDNYERYLQNGHEMNVRNYQHNLEQCKK